MSSLLLHSKRLSNCGSFIFFLLATYLSFLEAYLNFETFAPQRLRSAPLGRKSRWTPWACLGIQTRILPPGEAQSTNPKDIVNTLNHLIL